MRLIPLFIIVSFYACTTSVAGDAKEKLSPDKSSSKKVLLELFTSQGCSSCPSADNLVSSLAKTDTNLIVLSFHVDYWDRLGWKDVFSDHQYTARQQQYAQVLHAESYTPQAVVQGQYEMVGSNKNIISNTLTKVNQEPDEVVLTAGVTVKNSVANINYSVNKISANQQIAMALVQHHTETNIRRGENSGVQLAGYNVVRSFVMMPLSKETGSTQIDLPKDLEKDNASVVLFVQDNSSKKVIVVTQVVL